MTKRLSPTQFHRALTIEIPKEIRSQSRRVFFDVGSQLDEAIAVNTPVATGYLRASRAFTAGSAAPPPLEPPTASGLKRNAYRRSNPSPAKVLVVAVTKMIPFTTGFRADYALYVEDKVGMVKSAFARAGQFVRLAVANAKVANAVRGE